MSHYFLKKTIILLLMIVFLYWGYSLAFSCTSGLPWVPWELRKSDNIYSTYLELRKSDNVYIAYINDSVIYGSKKDTTITPLIHIKWSRLLHTSFNYQHDSRKSPCYNNYEFKKWEKYIIFEENGYISFYTNTVSFYTQKYRIYFWLGATLIIVILSYFLIKLSYYLKLNKNI